VVVEPRRTLHTRVCWASSHLLAVHTMLMGSAPLRPQGLVPAAFEDIQRAGGDDGGGCVESARDAATGATAGASLTLASVLALPVSFRRVGLVGAHARVPKTRALALRCTAHAYANL
jgi:hypothetical protein